MNANADNPLLKLRKLGQSVWQDDIGRNMLDDMTRTERPMGTSGADELGTILARRLVRTFIDEKKL